MKKTEGVLRKLKGGVYLFITCLALFVTANLSYGQFRGPSSSKKQKKALSLEISSKYESEQRFQEAIWTLRLAGHRSKADKLEKQLEAKLMSEPLSLTEHLDGISNPKKLKVGKGEVYAVFKSGDDAVRELLAYRLDRLLGLNIVPLTVKIDHHELGRGTLQYFIKNATKNPELYTDDVDFRRLGYPKDQGKMWLLDFLLNNKDRHGHNWLRRNNGSPIAIDHGHSMGRLSEREWRGYDSNIRLRIQDEHLPKGKILDRLLKIKKSDFNDIDLNINSLLKRRKKIIKRIKKIKPGIRCQFLFMS